MIVSVAPLHTADPVTVGEPQTYDRARYDEQSFRDAGEILHTIGVSALLAGWIVRNLVLARLRSRALYKTSVLKAHFWRSC